MQDMFPGTDRKKDLKDAIHIVKVVEGINIEVPWI